MRVLHRFSDLLRRRLRARADPGLLAILGPNIWGAQTPRPLFSQIVAEIGGRGPPFPPENIFSRFFQDSKLVIVILCGGCGPFTICCSSRVILNGQFWHGAGVARGGAGVGQVRWTQWTRQLEV